MSLNARGLNQIEKVMFLNDYLVSQNIDFCFLQETHFDSPDWVQKVENIFNKYTCLFTLNNSKTRGVGILINNYVENCSIENKFFDLESRYMRVEIKISSKLFNLINIYAPNTEKEQFIFINIMYDLCSYLKNIILGGDFNAITKISDRIGSSVKVLKNYENEWKNLYSMIGMKECEYENKMNNSDKMTWSNNGIFSRIDRFYFSKSMNINFVYTDVKDTLKSDHKAVIASLMIGSDSIPKVKKYRPWRLNDSILDHEAVI